MKIVTKEHRETALYLKMKYIHSTKMAWMEDTDWYMSYIIQFPENEWFYTTNAAANPLSNQYDMMQKFTGLGLIERRTIPIYVKGVLKGVACHWRYNLNLEYDHSL